MRKGLAMLLVLGVDSGKVKDAPRGEERRKH